MNFDRTTMYQAALAVVDTLNQDDYQAYLVGGCVRDLILGRDIADFDIATSARPEQVIALFPRTSPTGLQWGTVTVVWNDIPFEVTTFRGEGTYSDGRRPDSVVFDVTLEEDLKRRDFTVNAMAFHPIEGIIDPFGGQADLKIQCLRTVGDPFLRFSEDYLRILRGLRFSTTLGFSIHTDTADAMRTLWEGLHHVTRERITQEVKKMVMGQYVHFLVDFYPVLEEGIFYGLDCLWEAEDEVQLYEKLNVISKAPPLLTLRLALFLSLFHPDSGFLKLSKGDSREVDLLCKTPCFAWEERSFFYKTIQDKGREQTKLLLFYQKYHYPYHLAQLEELEHYLDHCTCTCLRELNIKGNDLIQAGVASGEMIGTLLHIALGLVISGQLENDRYILLETIL